VKRYGMIIGLKPERLEEYKQAHRNVWPEVLAMIEEANIRNYTIFYHDGMLFSYFEYIGDDYEADMAKIAANPRTQEWWEWIDPMQVPLDGKSREEGGEWWTTIEEVFHVD